MLLKNKVVIITGCNGGIGRAIVDVFAKNGAEIYACVRKESEDFTKFSKDIESKYGNKITSIPFDLSNREKMKEAASLLKKRKVSFDILVNNAGVAGDTLFQMTRLEDAIQMMNINFFSTFEFTQYIVKLMKKNSGSIVNITSIAAKGNFQGMVSYSASKAALESWTKTLSRELSGKGIRVNAVAPGFTNTNMLEKSINNDKFLENIIMQTSLKRLADPEEIANAVLFLASDLSSYITGQTLVVDGGL